MRAAERFDFFAFKVVEDERLVVDMDLHPFLKFQWNHHPEWNMTTRAGSGWKQVI